MLCTEVIYRSCSIRSKLLHRASFHTEAALTQKVLHRKTFAQKSFYTQPAMTQRSTNGNLLQEAFTHNKFLTRRSLYAKIFLHREHSPKALQCDSICRDCIANAQAAHLKAKLFWQPANTSTSSLRGSVLESWFPNGRRLDCHVITGTSTGKSLLLNLGWASLSVEGVFWGAQFLGCHWAPRWRHFFQLLGHNVSASKSGEARSTQPLRSYYQVGWGGAASLPGAGATLKIPNVMRHVVCGRLRDIAPTTTTTTTTTLLYTTLDYTT